MYYLNPDNYFRDDLDDRNVVVSIHCLVYNHENYIAQALEGFVMQQTNFRFEAIVHDDSSTDGTATIIREYAEKYPSIIKPIFETENQYSNPKGKLGRTMREHIRGKYVAYCEGDDYWTDPFKLQKQIDFLETHQDFSMCFHGVKVLNEFNQKSYSLASVDTRKYSANEIIESMLLQTASVVVRSDVLKSERYLKVKADKRFRSGDISLYLSAAAVGKIYCIADNMSIYRINSGGVTNVMRKDPFRFVYEVELMNEHFGDLFGRSFRNNLAKGYLRTLAIGVKSLKPKIVIKSIGGIAKYIWFLKPSSIRRSFARKRHE